MKFYRDIVEAHPNSKIYDKCWDGYRKVPGKKRGEKGSCEEIKENDVVEGGYYNPMDQERREQDAMDYSRRAFKRAELQHELGHEDHPDFERNLRQQQMDRDRGPWYIKINGKILKVKGEVKVFDWKRGANNYALAVLKNKPELKDKIFLTKKNQDDVKEFAPAGGGTPPRGPKTPGNDPWGGNGGAGDDPYSRPEPEYYNRSIDFFGKFEADHFDREDFDKKTGVFKGYWENNDGSFVQIAYFKFDNARQAAQNFDDSPGMGWYYEPQNESVAEGHADQQRKIFKKNGKPVGEVGIDRESSPGVGQWYMKCYAYDIDNSGYDSYEEAVAELKHCLKQGVAEGRFDEPLTGWHIVYRKSGNPVHATPSFETKDQAQKYLMTKMFANHQDYKVVHTAGVGVAEAQSAKTGIYQTDVMGAKAYHAKCMEPNCDWESKRFDSIKQAQASAEKHAKGHFKQGVAEVSDATLKSYQQKVSADSMKHSADPTKRSPEKASRSVAGFAKAHNRLETDSVTKKPQPYNDPDWAKKLSKDQLDALAGPKYKSDKKITKETQAVTDNSLGYKNTLAVMKAADSSQEATINLGGEPVTLDYPEARFIAGKYKAFLRAGRQEEFFGYMANPQQFDSMMKQLRNLIDKQKNFRGSVPGERGVPEGYSMDDLRKDAQAQLKKSIDSQSDARIAGKNNDDDEPFMSQVGRKIIGGVKGAVTGGVKGAWKGFTGMKEGGIDPNRHPQTRDYGRGEDYDKKHGSPYDRGGADSWYSRPCHPHKGGVGGDSGPRIEDLTPDEIKAYHAGYDENEKSGGKKQWESVQQGVAEGSEDVVGYGLDKMKESSQSEVWITGKFDGDTATTGPSTGSWRDKESTPVEFTRGRMSKIERLNGPPQMAGTKVLKQKFLPMLHLDTGSGPGFITKGHDLMVTDYESVSQGGFGRVVGTAYVKLEMGKPTNEKQGVAENLRLVGKHGEGAKTAKVYKDHEWGEYRVKFYTDGKHEGEEADYHTDDRDDANDTAKSWTTKGSKVAENTYWCRQEKTRKLIPEGYKLVPKGYIVRI